MPEDFPVELSLPSMRGVKKLTLKWTNKTESRDDDGMTLTLW